jgi:cystathionine beta-lyase/cystathionine gamma-synthase
LGEPPENDYSRTVNPTRTLLETQLAEAEGAKFASAYNSGLAAADCCLKLLNPGDHIVCSDDLYGGVLRLFKKVATRYQLEFTFVNTSKLEEVQKAIKPKTKMLWVETPTNPMLQISDIEKLGEISKKNNLIFVVDSTFCTPILLQPLELGASIVLHSTSKYFSGHSQLIGGALATHSSDLHTQLKYHQNALGIGQSPFDAWLTVMGLKTLHLRMERICENAQGIAEFLNKRPEVSRVIYPGLESHPQHALAKRQMNGFGGFVTFELKEGQEAAKRFIDGLKMCVLAAHCGGVETILTHCITMTHAEEPNELRLARGMTPGVLRISLGIEDLDDIVEDFKSGFESVGSTQIKKKAA